MTRGVVREEYIGQVRRVAAARFVSWVGTQAANIALVALVYQRTGGSGPWIAAALLGSLAARVAVSPWAGLLGDYFDRRRVMIGSDLAAAVCFVALSQAQTPWLLVALAALAAIAEAPFSPASGALLVMLAPEEKRAWASSMRATGSSMGMLLGGVAGGLLVAAFGAPVAFLVNAGSFLGSALLIGRIGGHYRVESARAPESRGAFAGMRLLWSLPALRASTASFTLVALALGMINVAEYPLFVRLGVGKVGFGIAIATWAAGQVVGARLASRITGAKAERTALISASALTALAVGLSGIAPWFSFVAAIFIVGGIGNTVAGIAAQLIAQRWAPPQLQTRVFAGFEAAVSIGLGCSLAVGGALLAFLSPGSVFIFSGALGALAAATAVRVPPHGGPLRPDPEPVGDGAETAAPPSRPALVGKLLTSGVGLAPSRA